MLYYGISGDIIFPKELILQKKVCQQGHIHQHPEAAGVTDYRTVQCLPQTHLSGCLVGCAKCSQSMMSIKWCSFSNSLSQKV